MIPRSIPTEQFMGSMLDKTTPPVTPPQASLLLPEWDSASDFLYKTFLRMLPLSPSPEDSELLRDDVPSPRSSRLLMTDSIRGV